MVPSLCCACVHPCSAASLEERAVPKRVSAELVLELVLVSLQPKPERRAPVETGFCDVHSRLQTIRVLGPAVHTKIVDRVALVGLTMLVLPAVFARALVHHFPDVAIVSKAGEIISGRAAGMRPVLAAAFERVRGPEEDERALLVADLVFLPRPCALSALLVEGSLHGTAKHHHGGSRRRRVVALAPWFGQMGHRGRSRRVMLALAHSIAVFQVVVGLHLTAHGLHRRDERSGLVRDGHALADLIGVVNGKQVETRVGNGKSEQEELR